MCRKPWVQFPAWKKERKEGRKRKRKQGGRKEDRKEGTKTGRREGRKTGRKEGRKKEKEKKLPSIPLSSKSYFYFFVYIPELIYNHSHNLHIIMDFTSKATRAHFLYTITFDGCIIIPLNAL
jgi:hypothetical protein